MTSNKTGWIAAIQKELFSLKRTDTYKVVKIEDLGTYTPILSLRLVLKNKLATNGTIARLKARLVVHGFK